MLEPKKSELFYHLLSRANISFFCWKKTLFLSTRIILLLFFFVNKNISQNHSVSGWSQFNLRQTGLVTILGHFGWYLYAINDMKHKLLYIVFNLLVGIFFKIEIAAMRATFWLNFCNCFAVDVLVCSSLVIVLRHYTAMNSAYRIYFTI